MKLGFFPLNNPLICFFGSPPTHYKLNMGKILAQASEKDKHSVRNNRLHFISSVLIRTESIPFVSTLFHYFAIYLT